MGIFSNRVFRYAEENFRGVIHTTLNPEGPGVVRIHLIPPAFDASSADRRDITSIGSGVAIINGQDVIPVNTSWTVLLSEFIGEVNRYAGRELSDEDVQTILKATCRDVRRIFPLLSGKLIRRDIFTIMDSFRRIAAGERVNEEIGLISLGEYAPKMKAPHRMDLMVSAMTKDGAWHCNQKCLHCYAAGQRSAEEAELPTEAWKTILDKCREAGIPQVTFTGGEPTMREDLCELIDYAKWFVTRLNTNGVRITPEYCRKLKEASLDSMQITFYSSDPAVHNALVGADRYAETVAGIENALAAGLSLSVNTPLCVMNRDYRSTLEFLHEKGVTYVTCSGLITTGNAGTGESERMQLSVDEIKAILRECADYAFANGMEISFTSPGWADEAFCDEIGITMASCGACLSNMAVTPGGNAVPCQSWLSDPPLGSMLTDDWQDIWNAPVCRERREYSAKMLGLCPLRRKEQ